MLLHTDHVATERFLNYFLYILHINLKSLESLHLTAIFKVPVVDIDNQELVVWYVAQLKNDDTKGREYCWAESFLENGVFQSKVYLEIWVKVRSNWRENSSTLKSLGIEE